MMFGFHTSPTNCVLDPNEQAPAVCLDHGAGRGWSKQVDGPWYPHTRGWLGAILVGTCAPEWEYMRMVGWEYVCPRVGVILIGTTRPRVGVNKLVS